MTRYGQYCPMARALDILGDRWTLLILRDMLMGATHFNELERGLPGISRGLLAQRLRRLAAFGVIEKQTDGARGRTAYHLTQAGRELRAVVDALVTWGAAWAFGDPLEEELDPLLLLWWMRGGVNKAQLPKDRVVVQFDFQGPELTTYWLVLGRQDVSVCITYPGYQVDVLATGKLETFFKLWDGWISFREAISDYGLELKGLPRLVRAFPRWFTLSPTAHTVSAARAAQEARLGTSDPRSSV